MSSSKQAVPGAAEGARRATGEAPGTGRHGKGRWSAKRKMTVVLLALVLTGMSLSGADLFSGVWRMQPNERGTSRVEYRREGDMLVWLNGAGVRARFRVDGKEYAGPSGGYTISFRQVDDATIESTHRMNGQVNLIETMRFSADGMTRTVVRKIMKGQEPVSEVTRMSRRVSGSADPAIPLAGVWANEWSGATGSPGALHIQVTPDELRLTGIYTVNAEFGEEHSASPDAVLARRLGDRKINIRLKSAGSMIDLFALSVAEDGKILTLAVHRENGPPLTETFRRE